MSQIWLPVECELHKHHKKTRQQQEQQGLQQELIKICTSALWTALGGLIWYADVRTSVEMLTGVAGLM